MPEYGPYEGFCYKIRRKSKREKGNIDVQKAIIDMAQISILVSNSPADYFTCMFEYFHYFKSHYVVQVTDELVHALLNSKLQLEMDELRLPHQIFEINFDTKTRIEGIPFALPGVLVCTEIENQDSCKEFGQLTGMDAKGINMFADTTLFSMRHGCPDKNDPLAEVQMHNCNLKLDELKNNNIEDVIEALPTILSGVAFNDQEKKIQKVLCHLVMSVICYLHMDEPDVEKIKPSNRPRMGNTLPNAFVLGRKMPAGSFFRKAHFRRLMHERFKRKDGGGFRTIWIKSYEVNKGQEAAHTTKKVEEIGV
jgi:hypothetical protein